MFFGATMYANQSSATVNNDEVVENVIGDPIQRIIDKINSRTQLTQDQESRIRAIAGNYNLDQTSKARKVAARHQFLARIKNDIMTEDQRKAFKAGR